MTLETIEIASIIASPDFLCEQGFDNIKKICYYIKKDFRADRPHIWPAGFTFIKKYYIIIVGEDLYDRFSAYAKILGVLACSGGIA